MRKLSASQEKSLRFVADNGGTIDNWAGEKGYHNKSIAALASERIGFLELIGYETCCNGSFRITPAGRAWLDQEVSVTEEAPEPVAEEAPEPTENVVSMFGGKVHSGMPNEEGDAYPLCRGGGMNQNLTKFTTTDAPLSCRTCLTYEERRNAAKAAEAHVAGLLKRALLVPPAVLAPGWKEVLHVVTGDVVGWHKPGKFRPVEDGMPTA